MTKVEILIWHIISVTKSKFVTLSLCRYLLWYPMLQVVTWNIRPKSLSHDDVITGKNFPRYWPFVRGIHWSSVNSPRKGQWRGTLMFSLICVWTNSWANSGEAGDLNRHHAQFDVIVISTLGLTQNGRHLVRIFIDSFCSFSCFFFFFLGGGGVWKFCILIQLKFHSNGPNNSKAALVYLIGDQPLSKQM